MATVSSAIDNDSDLYSPNAGMYGSLAATEYSELADQTHVLSYFDKTGKIYTAGIYGSGFTYGPDDNDGQRNGPVTGLISGAYFTPMDAQLAGISDANKNLLSDLDWIVPRSKFSIQFETPIAVRPNMLVDSNVFYGTLLAGDDTANLNVYLLDTFAGDGQDLIGATVDGGNDQIIVSERSYVGNLLSAEQREFQESRDSDKQFYYGDFFGVRQGAHLNGGDDVILLSLTTPTQSGGGLSGVTAVGDVWQVHDTASVTGGNDVLIGSVLGDVLIGDAVDVLTGGTLTGGDDYLEGGDGTDLIWGDAKTVQAGAVVVGGDDTIYGGNGLDIMRGQDGNDTFLIAADSEHPSDELINGGAGFDRILFNPHTAGETLQLSSLVTAVELVEMGIIAAGNIDARFLPAVIATLRGNDFGNTIQGSEYGERIEGKAGADVLRGNDGNDTILGDDGDDIIGGGAGTDEQHGGAGNDVLQVRDDEVMAGEVYDGGDDFDTLGLTGGLAHDMRAVAFTSIEAVSFDIGFSQAQKSLIVNAAEFGNGQLDANLEVIFDSSGASRLQVNLEGLTAFDASGFTFQNAGGGDVLSITGTAFADDIFGSSIGDRIVTGGGNDYVSAGAGNDTISGGGGIDSLEGRAGNDTISGGVGSDTLSGGLGRDRLEGGSGDDMFLFIEAPKTRDADIIAGFDAGRDSIWLRASAFKGGLSTGPLSQASFVNGTAAVDGDSRVIFDEATGRLFYDADGTGSVAAIKLATLTGLNGTLSEVDFVLI